MNFDKKCQLLIIGDAAVGKTCILRRFAQDTFNSNYISTLGIDFFTKDVILDKKKIHIKIWDTAGQERYRSLTQGFFKNGQGILIVYAINNKESFNGLNYWIDSLKNSINAENRDIPAIILGNKIDISDREVSKEDAENFAKKNNYNYFEVSAKTGQGIDESIKFLIKKVIENNEESNNNFKSIKIEKDDKKTIKLKNIKDCCNKN